MFIEFDQLPPQARVWLYQSKEPLSEELQARLKQELQQFISGWDAHGKPLRGSVQVLYGHFLVLAVDETYNPASGCSIDKSVHRIQELEQMLNVHLFDRLHTALFRDEKIVFLTQKQIKEEIGLGTLWPKTPVFNNLISTVDDLYTNWLIPIDQSWLGRLFGKATVSSPA